MYDKKIPKSKNTFTQNKDGIEVDKKDPIYDVMSEKEIDESSARFESLLEDANNQ